MKRTVSKQKIDLVLKAFQRKREPLSSRAISELCWDICNEEELHNKYKLSSHEVVAVCHELSLNKIEDNSQKGVLWYMENIPQKI